MEHSYSLGYGVDGDQDVYNGYDDSGSDDEDEDFGPYDRHIAEKYYTIAFGNEEASHQKARGYLSMVG